MALKDGELSTNYNVAQLGYLYPTYLELLLCAPVECAVVGPELEDAHLEAGGGHPVHDPAVRLRVRLHAEHLRQTDRVLQQWDCPEYRVISFNF